MDSKETDQELKEEQKQLKKESEKNKQALEKVNAYVEDAEIQSGAGAQELTQMKKKVASQQVQILDKDIDILTKEFALSKQEAINLIKKNKGNFKEALIYILNH